MRTENQRLTRLERLVSQALHKIPEEQPTRISQKEAMTRYNIGVERLRQMRHGYTTKGYYYPPIIFKWGHIRGKKIDYDVEELEQVFKRQYFTT